MDEEDFTGLNDSQQPIWLVLNFFLIKYVRNIIDLFVEVRFHCNFIQLYATSEQISMERIQRIRILSVPPCWSAHTFQSSEIPLICPNSWWRSDQKRQCQNGSFSFRWVFCCCVVVKALVCAIYSRSQYFFSWLNKVQIYQQHFIEFFICAHIHGHTVCEFVWFAIFPYSVGMGPSVFAVVCVSVCLCAYVRTNVSCAVFVTCALFDIFFLLSLSVSLFAHIQYTSFKCMN